FLLRHLLQSDRRGPLLLVGTYRAAELPPASLLEVTVAEQRRRSEQAEVALAGLEREEVGALVQAWAGAEPQAAFASELCEETGGNPFFVVEVLRHLLAAGAIRERDGRVSTSVSIERAGVP